MFDWKSPQISRHRHRAAPHPFHHRFPRHRQIARHLNANRTRSHFNHLNVARLLDGLASHKQHAQAHQEKGLHHHAFTSIPSSPTTLITTNPPKISPARMPAPSHKPPGTKTLSLR